MSMDMDAQRGLPDGSSLPPPPPAPLPPQQAGIQVTVSTKVEQQKGSRQVHFAPTLHVQAAPHSAPIEKSRFQSFKSIFTSWNQISKLSEHLTNLNKQLLDDTLNPTKKESIKNEIKTTINQIKQLQSENILASLNPSAERAFKTTVKTYREATRFNRTQQFEAIIQDMKTLHLKSRDQIKMTLHELNTIRNTSAACDDKELVDKIDAAINTVYDLILEIGRVNINLTEYKKSMESESIEALKIELTNKQSKYTLKHNTLQKGSGITEKESLELRKLHGEIEILKSTISNKEKEIFAKEKEELNTINKQIIDAIKGDNKPQETNLVDLKKRKKFLEYQVARKTAQIDFMNISVHSTQSYDSTPVQWQTTRTYQKVYEETKAQIQKTLENAQKIKGTAGEPFLNYYAQEALKALHRVQLELSKNGNNESVTQEAIKALEEIQKKLNNQIVDQYIDQDAEIHRLDKINEKKLQKDSNDTIELLYNYFLYNKNKGPIFIKDKEGNIRLKLTDKETKGKSIIQLNGPAKINHIISVLEKSQSLTDPQKTRPEELTVLREQIKARHDLIEIMQNHDWVKIEGQAHPEVFSKLRELFKSAAKDLNEVDRLLEVRSAKLNKEHEEVVNYISTEKQTQTHVNELKELNNEIKKAVRIGGKLELLDGKLKAVNRKNTTGAKTGHSSKSKDAYTQLSSKLETMKSYALKNKDQEMIKELNSITSILNESLENEKAASGFGEWLLAVRGNGTEPFVIAEEPKLIVKTDLPEQDQNKYQMALWKNLTASGNGVYRKQFLYSYRTVLSGKFGGERVKENTESQRLFLFLTERYKESSVTEKYEALKMAEMWLGDVRIHGNDLRKPSEGAALKAVIEEFIKQAKSGGPDALTKIANELEAKLTEVSKAEVSYINTKTISSQRVEVLEQIINAPNTEMSRSEREKLVANIAKALNGLSMKQMMDLKSGEIPIAYSAKHPECSSAKMANTANLITYWISEQILAQDTPEKRVFMMELFIDVADKLINPANPDEEPINLNAAAAIRASLESTSIFPFHNPKSESSSTHQLSNEAKKKLQNLGDVLSSDSNYKNQRSLRSSDLPVIAFLGPIKQDMEFANSGNKQFTIDDEINPKLTQHSGQVISDLHRDMDKLKKIETKCRCESDIADMFAEQLNDFFGQDGKFLEDKFNSYIDKKNNDLYIQSCQARGVQPRGIKTQPPSPAQQSAVEQSDPTRPFDNEDKQLADRLKDITKRFLLQVKNYNEIKKNNALTEGEIKNQKENFGELLSQLKEINSICSQKVKERSNINPRAEELWEEVTGINLRCNNLEYKVRFYLKELEPKTEPAASESPAQPAAAKQSSPDAAENATPSEIPAQDAKVKTRKHRNVPVDSPSTASTAVSGRSTITVLNENEILLDHSEKIDGFITKMNTGDQQSYSDFINYVSGNLGFFFNMTAVPITSDSQGKPISIPKDKIKDHIKSAENLKKQLQNIKNNHQNIYNSSRLKTASEMEFDNDGNVISGVSTSSIDHYIETLDEQISRLNSLIT